MGEEAVIEEDQEDLTGVSVNKEYNNSNKMSDY